MDLTGANWHRSTRSSGNSEDCVEAADNPPGVVPVRSPRTPGSPTSDTIKSAPPTPRAPVEPDAQSYVRYLNRTL
ncbi:DUF397 domain-containing protein [Plantactinospora sp. KBS50]|uniref:DUF397 domain-containing protein n=1 Tax=Plantactinospora sp. KBS50 TaxID=2024580 RepID=UPI000BAADBC2|nr:hypothetical protein CIK06_17135 [Plantactinospora sp. KBS50]